MQVTTPSKAAYDSFIKARKNSSNPFLREPAISATEIWEGVITDMSSLNGHIDNAIHDTIKEVSHNASKVGITIKGDRGTGKSHVIHRIWEKISTDQSALFSYIDPPTSYKHLNSQVCIQVCMDFTKLGKNGITQWQNFAASLIYSLKGTSWESEYVNYINASQDIQLFKKEVATYGREKISQLFDLLAEAISECHNDLDPYFLKSVLLTILGKKMHAQTALSWLKGEENPRFEALGLPKINQAHLEDRAIRVLEQITNLTSIIGKPLVLCFDQIERMPEDPHGGSSGTELIAKCVDSLYLRCKNIILICCLMPDRWVDIERLGTGMPDRVGQKQLRVKPPTAEQMVELVQLRLAYFYKENNLNANGYPPLYPFDEQALRKTAKEGVGVRDLFKDWCAKRFDFEPAPGPVPPPISKPAKNDIKELEDNFLTNFKELVSKGIRKPSDEDGIAALVEQSLMALPQNMLGKFEILGIEQVDSKSKSDLHFIFCGRDLVTKQDHRIGIRVCETNNANSFGAVIRRLLNYEKYNLTRGCLIRTTPVPRSWKKSKELEAQLIQEKGGEVISLNTYKRVDIKPLIALHRLYRGAEDYGFKPEQILELGKQTAVLVNNPLLQEILSAPA